MIALAHSAPMLALSRSVQTLQERVPGEQVGQKRGSDNAEDLSVTATPTKNSKTTGFQKRTDGNPDNPQECTRASCDANSECYFSHANKPWNANGDNARYPKVAK